MLVLLADDDEDDRDFTREAMRQVNPHSEVSFVSDGQELLDYLRRDGLYASSESDTRVPDVILLDLNMPRMTGSEALAAIRADETLKGLPVVVLTTSRREEDVADCYERGANSYISKPSTFTDLVEAMRTFSNYWADLVTLP